MTHYLSAFVIILSAVFVPTFTKVLGPEQDAAFCWLHAALVRMVLANV